MFLNLGNTQSLLFGLSSVLAVDLAFHWVVKFSLTLQGFWQWLFWNPCLVLTCEQEFGTDLPGLNGWLQPCFGAGLPLYRNSYNAGSISVYVIHLSLNVYGFSLLCPTFSFSSENISSPHSHAGNVHNSEGDTTFYISEAFLLCR